MTTDIRIIADTKHVETTVQAILAAIPGAVVTGRYFGRRRTQARIYIRCPEIPSPNLSALDEACSRESRQLPSSSSPSSG